MKASLRAEVEHQAFLTLSVVSFTPRLFISGKRASDSPRTGVDAMQKKKFK